MRDLLEYIAVFITAAVLWVCGLGMVCVEISMPSGIWITVHGWTCDCNGGEQ